MRKLVLLFTFIVLFASCGKKETPAAVSHGYGDPKQPAQTTTATSTAATTTGTDIGSTMPAYSATSLDGSKFDLAAKRNKVVLLNLWATWCGPCRYEIPELQSLHAKFEPKGFEVIGVSVDESGVEPVKQFVNEFKMTYPVVLDPEGKLATIFGTSVLPTTVLLDRNGRIVWKRYGQIMPGDTELEQAIVKAL